VGVRGNHKVKHEEAQVLGTVQLQQKLKVRVKFSASRIRLDGLQTSKKKKH
jgi:hypothetical protein